MTATVTFQGFEVYIDDPPEPIALAPDVRAITVTRGRRWVMEDIPVGTCTIEVRNPNRDYDPTNTDSPYAAVLKPGRRVEVEALGHEIFVGRVSDYNQAHRIGPLSTSLTLVDQLGALAKKDLAGFTATAGESTSERILSVLARPELVHAETGIYDIFDDVLWTLQGDVVETSTNALVYLQKVARTGLFRLFAGRDNSLVYTQHGITPHCTISDVPATESIPFAAVDVPFGNDLLRNRVVVSRVGGSTETFTDEDSVDEFGEIFSTGSAFTGLLYETDLQSAQAADTLIGYLANSGPQFSRFGIHVGGLTTAQANLALTVDIGDLVHGHYTPGGIGDPIDMDCVVEGVRHTLRPGSHYLELFVSQGFGLFGI